MINSILDPENAFWRWVCRVPHLLALSVLWCIMSIPLITLIPATVALYTAIVKKLRPDEKGVYRCYFQAFKQELRRGIWLSLIWILIVAVFVLGSYVLTIISDASEIWAACMIAYPLLWIPAVLILIWSVAVEARFNCKFWTLFQNAMVFAFGCKMKSLLILVITVLCIVACVFVSVLITILPALLILLWSLPIEAEFSYYYAKESTAEIEQETFE